MLLSPATIGAIQQDPIRRTFRQASLDLRFADNKSLVDAKTGASLVTFTRASSGTYVGADGLVKSATTNEARFDHNPTTGESLGLLVEEARTNLAFPSNMPTSTVQTTTGNMQANGAAQITSGVLAPDGATNGFTISGASSTTNTNGSNNVRILNVMAAAGTHTVTMWIKTNSSSTTVTVRDATSATSIPFTTTANWTRINATFSNTSAGNIILLSTSGTAFDCFGIQVEAAAFATSYIPTTTATVTRAADVASITGANFSSWYNQTEGTVFAEYRRLNNISAGRICLFSDTTANEQMRINGSVSANIRPDWQVIDDGSVVANVLGAVEVAVGATGKTAGVYKLNDFQQATNSILGTADTAATLPTLTVLNIGANETGSGSMLNGTIKRLTYWPVRLANPTLQSITTP